MLLKKVVTLYGQDQTKIPNDPRADMIRSQLIYENIAVDEMQAYRRGVLGALSECRPYYLDHNAAALVNSFTDDMTDTDYIRDNKLPADVVWVEYDAVALSYARERTGIGQADKDADLMGHRGVLIDNRDRDVMRIQVLRSDSSGNIIDPIASLAVSKDRKGLPMLDEVKLELTDHMREFYASVPDFSAQQYREFVIDDRDAMNGSMMMAFGMFALMNSKSQDISFGESEIFSRGEQKTARKFGKSHITGAPKSHITVNLTDMGKSYVAQLEEDASDRKRVAAGHAPKVRHTVREHERRYKSGKVITVKAHERGTAPDMRPTRVTASEPDESPSP